MNSKKYIFYRLLSVFFILFILSGCATKTTSTFVQGNTFISSIHPKLKIQVSDKIPFKAEKTVNQTGFDSYGSLSSAAITSEQYHFCNMYTKTELFILVQRFRGIAKNWEIKVADYSGVADKLCSGLTELNGVNFSTSTYLWTQENGCYLVKTYNKIFGAGNDVRIQIHYVERSQPQSPADKFMKEFSARADASFTILPYTEDLLLKNSTSNEENDFIKRNASKKEGTTCVDSLDCAKGYFCKNSLCVKGFTD